MTYKFRQWYRKHVHVPIAQILLHEKLCARPTQRMNSYTNARVTPSSKSYGAPAIRCIAPFLHMGVLLLFLFGQRSYFYHCAVKIVIIHHHDLFEKKNEIITKIKLETWVQKVIKRWYRQSKLMPMDKPQCHHQVAGGGWWWLWSQKDEALLDLLRKRLDRANRVPLRYILYCVRISRPCSL